MLKCLNPIKFALQLFNRVNVKMSKGFTLIELLVVISIIGIMSLITFPYYQSARQQLALQRAASRLVQDLRRAQEMAMANEIEEDCIDVYGVPFSEDYRYGFGVVFSTQDCVVDRPCKGQYILYADRNGNRVYQPSDPDYDIVLSNPDFDTVEVQSYSGGGNKLNVVFEPPDPIVVFAMNPGNEISDNEIFITLQVKNDPTKTKTIIVNKAGLIFVE